MVRSFFVACILFLFPAVATSQEYGFDIYNQDNGLSASYIYDITQDANGNVCLATENGLVLFNGYTFTSYDTTAGLNENMVSKVEVCASGKFFLGHFQEGLTYGRDKFTPYPLPDSPSTRISALLEIAPNIVAIGTKGAGLYVSNTSGKSKKVNCGESQSINAIVRAGPNYVAMATDNGVSIFKNEKGALTLTRTIANLEGKNIVALASDSSGNIFAAIQDGGIARIMNIGGVFTCAEESREDIYLPNGSCSDLCCDNKGNLFVAILGEGLYKYNYYQTTGTVVDRLLQSYTSKNGLSTNNIQSLFLDSENNLWIGTYGKGLIKYADQRFYTIKFSFQGLPAPVSAIAWFNTKYYAGTASGMYEIRTDAQGQVKMQFVGDSLGLPNAPVNFLSRHESTLFVVVNNRDLFTVIEGEQAKRIIIPIKNLNTVINDVTNSLDEMYFSTSEGLFIYNFESREFTIHNTETGLLHNNVKTAVRDSKGRIWITSPASKISYLQDDKINTLDALSGDRPYLIHCVLEDSKGNIWMGTDGDGLLFYDGISIKEITVDSGLASNYIYSLTLGSDNSIWAIHNRSITRISNDDSIKSYSSPQDFSSREFIASSVMNLPGGVIYFGTSAGILVYDAGSDYPNPRGPYCTITSSRFNTKTFFSGEEIDLRYSKYNVQFDFLGISHRDQTKVIYKYKLDGIDEDWRTCDYTQRFATYPQLVDGDYTFHVYCFASDNPLVSEEVTLQFSIGKPFWKSIWFYSLLAIVLIAGIYAYVRWKVKTYQEEQLVLQTIIAEKTSELREEKEALMQTTGLLQEKNKDITDSITYAKQIQEALLPNRNSILNQFPDSLIYHRPSHVVSGDFYWFSESEDHYLIGVVDCTGHGVPGAFMSLIAANLLDKTINIKKITSPAAILAEMDLSVVATLRQNEKHSTSRDGMDISICAVAKDFKTLVFGGAGRPLYHVRNGELIEYKGSKISIGGYYAGVNKNFTETVVTLAQGDVLYLSSDGYADQFDSENDKKYSSKRLKEMLARIAHHESGQQYAEIHRSFEEWRGDLKQIDDITIVGFKP